jgi:TonB-linked SusC/RagA family outer membrane protein
VTQTSSGFYSQNGFDSYFGRLNYSFKDKYLLGVSARNDGTSDLAESNRRGTFLGFSAGYRISEEEFYQSSGLSNIINSLKIRGSYAEVGNVDIPEFGYAGLYGAARYASQNGIAFSQASNPNLQWETSKKLNVGVDLSLFNNKYSLTVDYFQNDVDNIILFAPTAYSTGIPFNFGLAGTGINRNIGALTNNGLEVTAGAEIMNRGNFRWNVNANYTSVRNEITALVKNSNGVDQDQVFTYNIIRVGQPIGSLYGYEYVGVNPANGNPMYLKGDGRVVQRRVDNGAYSFYDESNPTNTTNTAGAALVFRDVAEGGDARLLGNTLPKWFGGFTNNFGYKGFDLEIFLRFSGGNKVYNATAQENLYNTDFTNGGRVLLNRWTPENTDTDVPRLFLNRNAQTNQTGNAISRFVENGDFLRVQNIVFGYNLPKTILEKTGSWNLRSVRLFAQVQNAFTFTKYSGLDPELNSSTDPRTPGIDFNTNPLLRTYTVGLNIGL